MYPIHRMFAVFGSSGSGKSTLIELLQKIDPTVTVHQKDTTREHRPGVEAPEGTSDLRFITLEEFEERRKKGEYAMVYHTYGNFYGVQQDQLTRAFENKELHFIIIRDIPATREFKIMHPETKAIYIHADPKNIPKRLKGRDGKSYKDRLKRTQIEYKDFIDSSVLFDHVILNFWDQDNAVRQLKNLLHFYAKGGILSNL